MALSKYIKLVIFAPETHTDIVRQAMGRAGAGKIGNYSFCSFSSKGTGRFLPLQGANPSVGQLGQMESVAEEKVETICPRDIVKEVIVEVKKVHPYEEVAIEIIPLEEI